MFYELSARPVVWHRSDASVNHNALHKSRLTPLGVRPKNDLGDFETVCLTTRHALQVCADILTDDRYDASICNPTYEHKYEHKTLRAQNADIHAPRVCTDPQEARRF